MMRSRFFQAFPLVFLLSATPFLVSAQEAPFFVFEREGVFSPLGTVLGTEDEREKEVGVVGAEDKAVRVITATPSAVAVMDEETRIKISSPSGRTRLEVRRAGERVKMKIKPEIPDDENGLEDEMLLEASPGATLVEVKEKSGEREFRLKKHAAGLEIEQRGASTTTKFPLSIDSATNELSVTTPAGTVVVKTLPARAVENILQSNIADRVLSSELTENPDAENREHPAIYKIKAEKDVKFLGFFPVTFLIETDVSVLSGEFLHTEKPFILQWFGFLFPG